MINYIITVLVLHAAALLIYELLLKKTTFLKGNRTYLLIVPVILWCIPFLNIAALNQSPVLEKQVYTAPIPLQNHESSNAYAHNHATQSIITNPASKIKISWWWIYITGVVISLLLFFKNFYLLSSLKSKGTISNLNGHIFYLIPDSNIALSFMGTILIGEQIKTSNLTTVIAHEQVHAAQKHHLDLLFFQLLHIAVWFNPFNYIFLNRLKLTHELLADRSVAHQLGIKSYTDVLMNETFSVSQIPFANMFLDYKTLKTRISMLYKKSTPQISKVRYAPIFVLLLSSIIYTSCTTFKEKEPTLETQINELNNRIKQLDSISLKDLESFDKLQMAISGYTIEDNSDYALLDKYFEEAAPIVNLNSPTIIPEKSELVSSTSGSSISNEGKNIIHTFSFNDEFDLPLYSNFKYGKKDFYNGISKDDLEWYKKYTVLIEKKFDNLKNEQGELEFYKAVRYEMSTNEGHRYYMIHEKISKNGTTIVINDKKSPREIMTIYENPNAAAKYGAFPSIADLQMSDIKYEVFKYWAVQNFPTMKNSISYSETALKDYYDGNYLEW